MLCNSSLCFFLNTASEKQKRIEIFKFYGLVHEFWNSFIIFLPGIKGGRSFPSRSFGVATCSLFVIASSFFARILFSILYSSNVSQAWNIHNASSTELNGKRIIQIHSNSPLVSLPWFLHPLLSTSIAPVFSLFRKRSSQLYFHRSSYSTAWYQFCYKRPAMATTKRAVSM